VAAHELHVTPAACGQQVKALEARLGVRLFERLHKQLVLTAGRPGLSARKFPAAFAASPMRPRN
jgi:hypothetical protein